MQQDEFRAGSKGTPSKTSKNAKSTKEKHREKSLSKRRQKNAKQTMERSRKKSIGETQKCEADRQGNDQESRFLKAQKTMFRAGSKRTW
jgi:hypothetical protein